jgi:hypothetical protein
LMLCVVCWTGGGNVCVDCVSRTSGCLSSRAVCWTWVKETEQCDVACVWYAQC